MAHIDPQNPTTPRSDDEGRVMSGEGSMENPEDESNIILDQDQTNDSDPATAGQLLGGEGNDNPPLSDTTEFIRGEVDLVDQMNKTIRAMDTATGKNRHGPNTKEERTEQ